MEGRAGLGRARAYLDGLQHHDAPEVRVAYAALVSHRDIGNGGLAQAPSNRRSSVDAVLGALVRPGPCLDPAREVVAEAAALHLSLCRAFVPAVASVG